MIRYLSLVDIAELAGTTPNTMRSYRSEGRLPEPDAMVGGAPGWLRETVDHWLANRPGRGAGGGRPKKA